MQISFWKVLKDVDYPDNGKNSSRSTGSAIKRCFRYFDVTESMRNLKSITTRPDTTVWCNIHGNRTGTSDH